ncbi:MAG: hypothetical protein A3F74_22660 [Betaproteobacteria bacterium RIFCSPLOWO2_12_FULL_62_58]|nr:MAG: hypothetical protein A3F74_22660 [Betaproteobacteria bacterium RIFCSPLOWO2_12_FULL_62_58]
MTSRSINLEEPLRNPGATFATPEEVVSHPGLTREQKVEILKLWEYDAAEAEVATEEGMPGDDEDLLRRILVTLHPLTRGTDVSRTGPTKQHALL